MGKRASYFRFRQRGFTLTEVAIVMLVVSVIIASIWTAASLVREKSHVSTAMNQFTTVAQNMTSLFQGGFGINNPPCTPAPCDFTAQAITLKIIPLWMQTSATQANTPWNSSGFHLWWVANNPRTYRVAFYGVSRTGCLGLIEQTGGCTPGQPGCPTSVGTGGNTTTAPTAGNTRTAGTITSADATALCAANAYPAGANNSVEFTLIQ